MQKKTFEQAIKRLDEIVSQLEEGNMSLEESIKIYEEGVKLTKFCSTRLNETEEKIKTLSKEGGEFKLKSTDI